VHIDFQKDKSSGHGTQVMEPISFELISGKIMVLGHIEFTKVRYQKY
jgi:hypothetical protein